MEIYELKYFLAVAQFESIRHASTKIRISSASLSKAIQRLEAELGIKLFEKEGRNIRLTSQGIILQKHASEIINLEEFARNQLAKAPTSLKCVLTGPEILLTEYGLDMTKVIESKYDQSEFELNSTSEKNAIASLSHGDAHLGLIAGDIPPGFISKTIASVDFSIVVGKKHPLYPAAKSKKTISLEKVLEFPFAIPSHFFLGQVDRRQSTDGWRDDKWPRKMKYATSCLKMLEAFVTEGRALAYLPEYYAKHIEVENLMTDNQKIIFSQEVKLVASQKNQRGWVMDLFQSK